MPKLNARQKCIIAAISNLKQAGRGVVVQFEAITSEYWGIDRCRTDNLEFFVNALKRMPRLQSAAIKLLPMYAPVSIKQVDGIYLIKNRNNTSKKVKAKGRNNVQALIDMQLDSLLHHPKFGGKGDSSDKLEFDWAKRQVSFKAQVGKLMDNGVSEKELLDLIMAAAVAKANESLPGIVIEINEEIKTIAPEHNELAEIELLEASMSA